MILFQDVIKILHGAMLAVLLQNTLVFELYNRRRVRGMLLDGRQNGITKPVFWRHVSRC